MEILDMVMVGCILAYPIPQLVALLKCQGWWLTLAILCLIPATPCYIGLVSMYIKGSGAPLITELMTFLVLLSNAFLLTLSLGVRGFSLRCQTQRPILKPSGLTLGGTAATIKRSDVLMVPELNYGLTYA